MILIKETKKSKVCSVIWILVYPRGSQGDNHKYHWNTIFKFISLSRYTSLGDKFLRADEELRDALLMAFAFGALGCQSVPFQIALLLTSENCNNFMFITFAGFCSIVCWKYLRSFFTHTFHLCNKFVPK